MPVEKIDPALCKGCGVCVKTCPEDVFRLDNENKKAVIRYPEDCMICGWCTIGCPTDAITVTWQKASPLYTCWG